MNDDHTYEVRCDETDGTLDICILMKQAENDNDILSSVLIDIPQKEFDEIEVTGDFNLTEKGLLLTALLKTFCLKQVQENPGPIAQAGYQWRSEIFDNAANQVGILKRLVVIGYEDRRKMNTAKISLSLPGTSLPNVFVTN